MQIKRGSKRSLHWEETLWTFAAAGRRPIAPFIKWLRERGRDQVAGRLDIAAMLFANPEGHKHLS